MSYTVTRQDILTVQADAAVLCVENKMVVAESMVSERLAEAGGEEFRRILRKKQFLPVGNADALDTAVGPFSAIILAATPRWNNAEANEIQVLRICYRNVFHTAEESGFSSVAMPFLSASYYRFPREDAVHVALTEAEKTPLQVIFVAENQELHELSLRQYRKPELSRYIGYYRDHAIFELDNGQHVRIDIRPENREVTRIPYFAPCYRTGNNPLQEPLPEEEVARLRKLYYELDW